MNPPVPAALGTEARNLNTPHRDGTGAVPGRKAMGTEAQATQPSAAPFPQNECACPLKACRPEANEGRVCWRSGHRIPEGYFSNTPTSSEGTK